MLLRRKKILAQVVSAALLLPATYAFAEAAPDKDKIMERIVVTASGFEQQVRDAPQSLRFK